MLEHQKRVVEEKNELDKKIVDLENFISESDIYKGLDDLEKDKLSRQYGAMLMYSGVLDERIREF